MNLRDRAKALGINPDDRSYSGGGTFGPGDKPCGWCHLHAVRNPRLRCDCQQAEAAIVRNNGGEAFACSRCHEPTPKPGSICTDCQATDAAQAKKERRRPRRFSSAAYRDDGYGCVERVHPTELLLNRLDRGSDGF